eukprot:gnl/Dysnectes_brevis/316_a350_5210.p1 GENE.gnl/Dysnectes_brevis/316_a350_5210~~gnl/Dysnectes_brevis/316_a350_5210.p1  ORF type:complete len:431 (-),score=72.33 gnl/Dysnectes_brevis/316_a350_5210:71-1363(-)
MSQKITIKFDDLTSGIDECIVPLIETPPLLTPGEVKIRKKAEKQSTAPAPVAEPIKISVDDCLMCSGCVTSAEVILLQEQNPDKLKEMLKTALENRKTDILLSVSSHSLSSLAHVWHCTLIQAAQRLITALQSFTTVPLSYVPEGIAQRVAARDAAAHTLTALSSGLPLPRIVTVCPAVRLYIGKRGPSLIPHLDNTPSPTEIAGHGLPPSTLHISVQPCFDKKIEVTQAHAADLIVSTSEAQTLTEEVPSTDEHHTITSPLGGRSPFYRAAEATLDALSQCGWTEQTKLEWRRGTNRDMLLADISLLPSAPVAGPITVGRFSGFRNLQNLVRRVRRGGLHLVEVYACPGGCSRGAGQVARPEETLMDSTTAVIADLEDAETALGSGAFEVPSGDELTWASGVSASDVVSPEELAKQKKQKGIRLTDLAW